MKSLPAKNLSKASKRWQTSRWILNTSIWRNVSIKKSDMQLQLQRVCQFRDEKVSPKTAQIFQRGNIVGSSQELQQCLDLAHRGAGSDVNVLITGETGMGKELFARAIHNNSHRAQKSFIVLDCASLPESLMEDVLFGHEKGAFTGADKYREGLIRQADGGTLFLDEVTEMPIDSQRKFLRAFQEHHFLIIGSDQLSKSDFRLIAATNKNIGELVGEIALASTEQAQGIEQVNKAITEMDETTQQNAANAEESASASEELNAQAEQMNTFVGDLAALVGGTMQKNQKPSQLLASAVKSKAKQIAGSPNKSKKAHTMPKLEVSPEKLIPLDDNDFQTCCYLNDFKKLLNNWLKKWISPRMNSIKIFILAMFLPFGKVGELQILSCQGFAVVYYSFTLSALTLEPSNFCNVGVIHNSSFKRQPRPDLAYSIPLK